ncbi:MAG: leucine-rich repeat domain-containing protein [Paludibacteraceae bacterium]|nr:leucine-rich repeat domain-containing protein [Paludibacteraceae bacterium]
MKQVLINGIQYELDRKTHTAGVVSLADGNKYAGKISIPAFIIQKRFLGDDQVYHVNHIHSNAFANSDIISIVIPHSVIGLDNKSFNGCSSLKKISLPKELQYIGAYAFNGCSQLTSVQLPKKLTTLATGIFRNCKSLANIVIPDSITRIEENAFENCTSLISISIPKCIKSIAKNSFTGCSSITTIIWDVCQFDEIKEEFIRIKKEVPVAVKLKMEKNPFYPYDPFTTRRELNSPFTCIKEQITSFVFGDNVKQIPSFICEDMRNLNNVTFGNSIENVGKDAFKGCSSIESICWNVKQEGGAVDKKLFDYCLRHMNWGIKSITFGEQITDIPDRLCENIRNLNSVKFGSNVKSVGENAFAGTEWLKNHTDNIHINRYLYKAILPNNVSTYTISKETLGILSGAFSICTSLKSIIIPNTITSIGKKAFLDCKSLETISIPNSVTSIGEEAFAGCSSLTSIVIPDSVTSIGKSAFEGCSSLASINIPKSVTDIGEGALSRCPNLISITVEYDNSTYDSRNNCHAIIKTDTNTLISGCQNTSIPNNVTSIGDWAFAGCYYLTSVTIPSSVKSIGERAFMHCSSLAFITIPSSVTSIGTSAFSSCSSLTSLIIPNSVTSIGERAFFLCKFAKSNFVNNSSCEYKCYGEQLFDEETNGFLINDHEIQTYRAYLRKAYSIEIPHSITSIKEDFFRKEDFPYLTSIVWDAVACKEIKWEEGNGSYSWNKKTFYGPFAKIASQITSFEFGPNVKHIPNWLCTDMDKLKKITIPTNVMTIENKAFSSSSFNSHGFSENLKEITIPVHIYKKIFAHTVNHFYNDLQAIFYYAEKINVITSNINQLLK